MNTELLGPMVAAIVSIGLGATATFNAAFAAGYVRKSPKAYIWRKVLGEPRAIVAVRYGFGPLTVLIGIGLLAFSLLATLSH
jgi:hypothetical protein